MDEINNNQTPEIPTLEVRHPDLRVFAGVVILVFLAIYIVLTLSIKMQTKTAVVQVPVPVEVSMPEKGPQKNDLAGEVPTSFGSGILLESKDAIQESYLIDYGENEQATAVFLSPLSPKEKYDEYSSQLVKDRWVIMKRYESDSIYSLYALKEKDELNVTISPNPSVDEVNKTQVSISLLKNK